MATIALATLVVGLRHVLMGAALGPVFSKLPRLKAYGSVFFMADENWALTMGEFAKGRRDAAFLLGGGLLMFLAWTGSTFVGGAFGGAVEDPARWGLDFAFTAVFLALIAGMWKGRSDILPWAVAATVAVAAHQLAARSVVHPARRPGGKPRRGGAAWRLVRSPCLRYS